MNITKKQLKQLRYILSTAPYNQPCVKEYTQTPNGKFRKIGKFKYTEKNDELLDFEYDGCTVDLSNYDADSLINALIGVGGPILVGPSSKDTNDHNDIVDAIAAAIEHINVHVPPQGEVHKVDIPIEVQPASDGWMDDEGNDPDNLDQGTADIPELLTEEEKKAAEEDNLPSVIDTSTEIPPVEMTENAITKEDAEKSIEDVEGQPLTGAPTLPFVSPDAFKGIKMVDKPVPPVKTPKQMSPEELTEDVVREISMTAAAREAARLHQIEYMNLPDIPSQNIIRANAKIPGFLDDYGKCLKKVGMARTLAEIAKALPGQIDWIFR